MAWKREGNPELHQEKALKRDTWRQDRLTADDREKVGKPGDWVIRLPL